MKLEGAWAQAIIAVALAVIAAGIAWGHIQTQVSSDHDILIEIRADVKDVRHELRDLDRRIIHLEAQALED